MGQIQNQCSCLFKKDEIDTYKFEPNGLKEYKDVDTYNNNLTFKDKLLKSKSFRNLEESNKVDLRGSIASNSIPNNWKDNGKIVKIQAYYRGFILRNNWSRLKQSLIELENEQIDRFQRMFKTTILVKAEMDVSTSYDKNGWKNFYDNNSQFEFNYGNTFNVKIRVYEKYAYYSGSMNLNGEKHGYGVLLNKNGVKYEGFWKNNIFSGWGRMIDNSGTIYEGYFENGLLNGKGERRTNKSCYKGEFKNGMRDGIGHEETKEHSYIGEFKMDKKHGNGKLSYKKMNDVYEGEFNENSITGYGYYIWSNKDTFRGTFLNGKMHGRGVYTWPDGGEYIGEYVNNIKEGHGRFKWSNGKIFEGPFRNGRSHGLGKLIYGDNIIEVEFKEGKLSNSTNNSHKIVEPTQLSNGQKDIAN